MNPFRNAAVKHLTAPSTPPTDYIATFRVKMSQEFLANTAFEAGLQNIEATLLSHGSALRDVIQKLCPHLEQEGAKDAKLWRTARCDSETVSAS